MTEPPSRFGPPPEVGPAAEEELELAFDPAILRHPPEPEAAPEPAPQESAGTPASAGAHPGDRRGRLAHPASPGSAAEDRFSQFEPGPRRRPWGKLALGALVMVAAVWWRWPVSLRDIPLTPASSYAAGVDPCIGKAQCLTVITAPWCPSCRDAHRTIVATAEHFKDSTTVGVRSVVSFDELPKLEADAQGFEGTPVFVDPTGAFMKVIGEKTIPRFVVSDARGRVTLSTTEWQRDLQAEIAFLGLGSN